MTLTPATIRLLAEKGLSALEIAEIAEAQVPARSSGAERQARYRQRKKAETAKRNDGDVTDNVTPPNDIYSNPPVSPSLANANDCPPFEIRFVEAWNAETGLRPARKLTGQRLAKLRRREKEFGQDALLEAVRKLGASPFHCGKNDREWQANAGWLIKNDENVVKALELPDPRQTGKAAPPMTAEQRAEFYRKIGRDDDAEEIEKREAKRTRSTGPPRPIGEVLRAANETR